MAFMDGGCYPNKSDRHSYPLLCVDPLLFLQTITIVGYYRM